MKTVKIEIYGKVQGVFFRASAAKEAEHLNISGWIRNTDSGNVEALVSGEDEKVDSFIQWCRTGPKKAVVEKVTTEELPFQSFDSFKVIR